MKLLYKTTLLVFLFLVSCGQHPKIQNATTTNEIKDIDLVVSPNGNDTQTGRINSPLKTIAAAVKQAKPNTVIYLKEGTYSENTILPASKKTSP